MAQTPQYRKSLTLRHWIFLIAAALAILVILAFGYVNAAFPKVRCEAFKHLEAPEASSDCYTCHQKTSPKTAQDWLESKHGVNLVKCFVCHGQPDGKGSVPWAVKPDVDKTCRKCHDPSIRKMQKKYGADRDCSECHPFHNNSLHHAAYEKTKTKTTIE
ncbi:MAG: hypothetical protein P8X96_17375 [Desulfobacteraceae bacterium]